MAITIRNTTSFKSGKIDMTLPKFNTGFVKAAALSTALAVSGAVKGDESPEGSIHGIYTGGMEFTQEQEFEMRDAAEYSAEALAKNNFGVGIVFHGGQDIPNQQFQTYAEVAELFKQRFKKLLDEAYPDQDAVVDYFVAPNDVGVSGVTLFVADRMFRIDNARYGRPLDFDPALLTLQDAWDVAPEIVEILLVAKAVQRQREAGNPVSLSSAYVSNE